VPRGADCLGMGPSGSVTWAELTAPRPCSPTLAVLALLLAVLRLAVLLSLLPLWLAELTLRLAVLSLLPLWLAELTLRLAVSALVIPLLPAALHVLVLTLVQITSRKDFSCSQGAALGCFSVELLQFSLFGRVAELTLRLAELWLAMLRQPVLLLARWCRILLPILCNNLARA